MNKLDELENKIEMKLKNLNENEEPFLLTSDLEEKSNTLELSNSEKELILADTNGEPIALSNSKSESQSKIKPILLNTLPTSKNVTLADETSRPLNRAEVIEQDKIHKEKIEDELRAEFLKNEKIKELEKSGNGGLGTRDKKYILLGLLLSHILVYAVFGTRFGIGIMTVIGLILAFIFFIIAYIINEFTPINLPEVKFPLLDSIINIIWDHKITAGGIIFAILVVINISISTVNVYFNNITREELQDVCLDGDAESCVKLASFYTNGIKEIKHNLPVMGETVDPDGASLYYGKACDLNDGKSCYIFWKMWLNQDASLIDESDAIAKLNKACDNKFSIACTIINNYDNGNIIEPMDLPILEYQEFRSYF